MTARTDPRRNRGSRGNAAFRALHDEPTYSEEWHESIAALYAELGITSLLRCTRSAHMPACQWPGCTVHVTNRKSHYCAQHKVEAIRANQARYWQRIRKGA